MNVVLRPIRHDDDACVAGIIRTVMTEYGAVGEGYSIEDAEVDAMTDAYSGGRAAYFVVEVDGRVAGGAGIGPLDEGPDDVCELKKMYLLPEARGRGLGKRLLEACLAAARSAGYTCCYLETLDRMLEAGSLYARNGFERLDAPMGATGHHRTEGWYLLTL